MIKVHYKSLDSCKLFHSWRLIKADFNAYYQCKNCGSRKSISTSKTFSEVDMDWIYGFKVFDKERKDDNSK